MTGTTAGLILALDTATRSSVVVLGTSLPAGLMAASVRSVGHRHGSQLLEQLDEVLAAAQARLDDVRAVGVGTGPGSFTGLRVGLATAKTLAHVRQLPIVGISSTEALRRAAVAAGAPASVAVILPAGAHDHYLARPHGPAELVAPGGLAEALGAAPAASVDGAGADDSASRLGEAAVAGLPTALLALVSERLAEGAADDAALLVPAYVALPRGVRQEAEDLAWSPDLR